MTQGELAFAATHTPYSEHETSRDAALAIVPHVAHLEAIVLQAIRDSGGLCDHEIEAVTGLIHQTASARRRGLVLKGLIRDSGERRLTASGRRAKVWVAA